jgi:hypothetical protein
MSRTEQRWCDLSEEPDTDPAVAIDVLIGYQGETYAVDLGEDALKRIEELMTAVASRGRRVTGASGGSLHASLTPHQIRMVRTEHGRRVREWWRSRGNDIGDTGSIPWDAVDAYNTANPKDFYEK